LICFSAYENNARLIDEIKGLDKMTFFRRNRTPIVGVLHWDCGLIGVSAGGSGNINLCGGWWLAVGVKLAG